MASLPSIEQLTRQSGACETQVMTTSVMMMMVVLMSRKMMLVDDLIITIFQLTQVNHHDDCNIG